MDVIQRFRAAVEARDLSGFDEIFAPNVRLVSPVKFTPFEGRDAVLGVMNVLLRTFTEFTYVGELAGEAQMGPDGPLVPSHILIFRAVAAGKQVHGIDLIQPGPSGLIEELTVMVRPLSAVTALGDAVLAGLVEDGLVPAAGGVNG
jgi:SnoaL-like domain